MYKKYERELNQSAPYSLRVYVLAEHKYDQKKSVLDKNAAPGEIDRVSCCQEQMLFEVKKENFFPDKSIFDSIMIAA